MKPYKRPYGGTPGPPVMYEKPSDPEDEGAGYGYTNAENIQEKDIYFYHSDHLGSTSYITDANGEASQFVCYKPYGEALVDEHNTSYEQPWKFNGKELDSETGLYYYGARYYEPTLTLWYGVDALAEKYPNMGGYVYCAGNPVKFVDPDGNENVVVCGAQYDNSAGNKLMFVNQGIRALRQYQKNAPNESRSMVLFQHGYTENQINEIRSSVENYGGSLVLVNSVDEMASYVNNRTANKISNMEIYAHGLSGSIEFGYNMQVDNCALTESNVDLFSKNAFSDNAHITSYACRSALGTNASVIGFGANSQNSIAQFLADASGVMVSAYARRTNYSGTLGSALDRHPLLSFGMPVGVIAVPIPTIKMVDGAAFTPQGANRGVVVGDSPIGISMFMLNLSPSK